MQKANPLELVRLPREKGREFTDPTFTVRERQPSQNHYAIRPDRTLGIQHRLTNGMTPKINGAVGPINKCIRNGSKDSRTNSARVLPQTLLRHVTQNNHKIHLSNPHNNAPTQSLSVECHLEPNSYNKHPQNLGKHQD